MGAAMILFVADRIPEGRLISLRLSVSFPSAAFVAAALDLLVKEAGRLDHMLALVDLAVSAPAGAGRAGAERYRRAGSHAASA
jgi:hypothetical protein